LGVANGIHSHGDPTKHPPGSDGGQNQTVTEEITVGPQANFTLLDQMSELKKIQSRRMQNIYLLTNKTFNIVDSDASDQTSTDKMLEVEEEILRNVVETRG
jgi:hypothetical protein